MVQRLLDDKLLQGLMAVGQVDIVLGLPTLDNAPTIADTVKMSSVTLASRFPRARSVIITADTGSNDGTADILQKMSDTSAARAELRGALRTQHHLSTEAAGLGRAGAIRTVFAAADLLQARAVVLLDPCVACLTPTWISSIISAVWKEPYDFAMPRYDRHPLDAPLLSQLVRPLLRATYGLLVQEPLIGEFGASGAFARYCLAQDFWDSGPSGGSIEPWLTSAALGGTFTECEVFLGTRTLTPEQALRPALRDVFTQVVGSLFRSLDAYAEQWLPRQGSTVPPAFGLDGLRYGGAPAVDATRLGQSFSQDVSDLEPVLASFLATNTMRDLQAVAASAQGGVPTVPDELWVAIVYDTLLAHHAATMNRAHLVQALLPLYLGRVASFVTQHSTDDPTLLDDAVEQLSLRFEGTKPYLVERWNQTPQR